MVVEQGTGDTIFVPSGWYHMVENLGDTETDRPEGLLTVSFNHNWLNGFGIYESWRFLLHELIEIRFEINNFWNPLEGLEGTQLMSDQKDGHNMHAKNDHSMKSVPLSFSSVSTYSSMMMSDTEWYEHCELLLKSNAAMNLREFIEMFSSRAHMMMTWLCSHMRLSRGDSQTDNIASSVWSAVLCPEYSAPLTDADIRVCQTLYDNHVDELPMSENVPSTYFRYCDIDQEVELDCNHSPRSIYVPVLSFESNLKYVNDRINDGMVTSELSEESFTASTTIFPMTALKYSLLQVHRILHEMISSDEILAHLSIAFNSALQKIAVEKPLIYNSLCLKDVLIDLQDSVAECCWKV